VGIDFGFGLALLFIAWGVPLVGCIPVVSGWGRTVSQWNSSGQRALPKALCALTASICIDPVGFSGAALIDRWDPTSLGLADVLLRITIGVLLVGFIMSVIAFVIAAREHNSARASVLAGSIAVAAVNLVGFAWLLSTPRGNSMWTN